MAQGTTLGLLLPGGGRVRLEDRTLRAVDNCVPRDVRNPELAPPRGDALLDSPSFKLETLLPSARRGKGRGWIRILLLVLLLVLETFRAWPGALEDIRPFQDS